MAEYDPKQQAAVNAYLGGGGSQADVDKYFAGNPSSEQFLRDAGAYWNVDAAGTPFGPMSDDVQQNTPPGAQAANPQFDKLRTDVTSAYLGAGGSQADIDAYFANNPSYEQLATDASKAFLENGGSTEELSSYFGLPAGYDFSSIMQYNPYSGTNIRSDGSKPNAGIGAPGSGDIYDPWRQSPTFFGSQFKDKTGNLLPGYAYGPNGDIVKNVEGGNVNAPNVANAPQGTPSIFDMFNDLYAQFQQSIPKNTNWYGQGFQAGGTRDPMVIQNAIQAQDDPNSMAGLFKNLVKSYKGLQQQQGQSPSIMPALEQGGSYGGTNNPYASQYAPPPPAAPTVPTTPGMDPRIQEKINKVNASGQMLGKGF